MRNYLKPIILILLFSPVLFFFSHEVSAQDEADDPLLMEVSAGFDDFFRGENWIPIHVTLANNGPLVDGYIQVETGTTTNSGTEYRLPVTLPTQSRQQATLYIFSPNFGTTLDVKLRDTNGNLLLTRSTTMRRVNDGEHLYAVVSPDPGEFTFLESISSSTGRVSVAFMELEELPETAVAWKALDMVILNDVDTAELSPEQISALRQWVNNGGQLVITGGSSWQKTTSGLLDLLPVTVSGSRSIADLPALRAQAGFPFRDDGPYLIAESQLRSGSLLYFDGDLPVLAVEGYGRGNVFFLALDPRFAPLQDWDGHELLWQDIINRFPSSDYWGLGPQNSYASSSAVSSLPALALPSILTLLIFLLLYILLIGPLNYFFLKRSKRTELAWATIPVIVLVFSAATYVTGFQLRGNTTIINQMNIAYSDAGAEEANVHSLIGLYSPRRMNYDMVFGQETLARPFRQEFGTVLGSGDDNSGIVTFAGQNKIEGIRVDISGIETFIAEGNAPAVQLNPVVYNI